MNLILYSRSPGFKDIYNEGKRLYILSECNECDVTQLTGFTDEEINYMVVYTHAIVVSYFSDVITRDTEVSLEELVDHITMFKLIENTNIYIGYLHYYSHEIIEGSLNTTLTSEEMEFVNAYLETYIYQTTANEILDKLNILNEGVYTEEDCLSYVLLLKEEFSSYEIMYNSIVIYDYIINDSSITPTNTDIEIAYYYKIYDQSEQYMYWFNRRAMINEDFNVYIFLEYQSWCDREISFQYFYNTISSQEQVETVLDRTMTSEEIELLENYNQILSYLILSSEIVVQELLTFETHTISEKDAIYDLIDLNIDAYINSLSIYDIYISTDVTSLIGRELTPQEQIAIDIYFSTS